jgi:hypothetical protein
MEKLCASFEGMHYRTVKTVKVSKLFKWISLSCRKTFPYILYFL